MRPENADSFLAHLPASVIKNGKIFNIREDIADILGVNLLQMKFFGWSHDRQLRNRLPKLSQQQKRLL